MRSLNGGWHGFAGWGCFRRFPEAGAGLRADDGANSLSDAGSPVAVTNLRLAELRSMPQISGIVQVSCFLAAEARRPAVFGSGRAFEFGEACRDQGRRRGFSTALSAARRG